MMIVILSYLLTYLLAPRRNATIVNSLKRSGVTWLHFEVFSAIQV